MKLGVQRHGPGYSPPRGQGLWSGCVSHHQVELQALVELQGGDIVGLLQIVDHQQLPVLETARTQQELLQTLLQRHTLRLSICHDTDNPRDMEVQLHVKYRTEIYWECTRN